MATPYFDHVELIGNKIRTVVQKDDEMKRLQKKKLKNLKMLYFNVNSIQIC